jgi:hypothetical protein
MAGLVYPAYATCKALDQAATSEKSHWLCYWLAFGGVSALEGVFTQRFPGYYHIKLLLLVWLQSRRYQGARRLYTEFLRPLVRKARPKVDNALSKATAWTVRPASLRRLKCICSSDFPACVPMLARAPAAALAAAH